MLEGCSLGRVRTRTWTGRGARNADADVSSLACELQRLSVARTRVGILGLVRGGCHPTRLVNLDTADLRVRRLNWDATVSCWRDPARNFYRVAAPFRAP